MTLRLASALRLTPFQLYQYVGLLSGLTLGAAAAARVAIDPNLFAAGALLLLPLLMVSAHIGPALVTRDAPTRSWLAPREGSSSIFAVPILLVAVPLVAEAPGISIGRAADAACLTVAAASVAGRAGCAWRGCCYGR